MIEVGGGPHYMLKPVQIVAEVEDPLDSYLVINVVGAKELLSSWSLEITDEHGKIKRFGPSTQDHETISGIPFWAIVRKATTRSCCWDKRRPGNL